MKILIAASVLILSFELSARQIQKITFSYWEKPDIDIYYSSPKSINANTKLLFLMHGGSRAAEKYINDWISFSKDRNVVLVAPEFSKKYYPEYAFLMMSKENGKSLNDESLYINNSLGLLFDFFKAKLKLPTSNYRLYGHSGGSQFVHRYLLLSNDTRIEKAAMANAGFYTFLDDEITYPFGTKKMKISDERIKWFYRLKGGVFLGSADNDSNHESLPRMRKARKQGKNRLERGKNFFEDLVKYGVDNNLPFRWRFQIVSNVGHSNIGMSMAASEFLLEDL
jgi:pimeloyl-ACP methyl ester carboxylesterase